MSEWSSAPRRNTPLSFGLRSRLRRRQQALEGFVTLCHFDELDTAEIVARRDARQNSREDPQSLELRARVADDGRIALSVPLLGELRPSRIAQKLRKHARVGQERVKLAVRPGGDECGRAVRGARLVLVNRAQPLLDACDVRAGLSARSLGESHRRRSGEKCKGEDGWQAMEDHRCGPRRCGR